jgi:hypothetical protein
MATSGRSVLREGVLAGLIGAAVVALWFLVLDVVRGRPLLTPTILGAAVFYGVRTPEGLEPALLPVLGYTLIHGLAFIAFGIIAASLIAVSEREPPVFAAFVILFAAFEVFFLGVVSAFGQSMLGALVWWAILIGNLLASIAMLAYFFRLHRALPRTLLGDAHGTLTEGVIAGLLGAVVVAVWFLAIDTVHGEPLRTPTLLGSGLLRQSSEMDAVILYSIVHGLAFIVFGIVTSALVAAAERQPFFVFALIILFCAFEIGFFGAIVLMASWMLGELAGWTIFAGNVLAAAAMLTYFVRRHPALGQRLTHAWLEED